ncbi:peptidase [Gardnerella sp. KA00747]|uniref:peptidase n=1 Tax=Gardnerella sp. KA00747 TaxID=2749078 RepID=UPI003BA875DC
MASSNSRRHARKVTLDAAVSNAISKAVKARKVAAFTVGAAGVLAGAAFAFGATPAMAAEAGALTSPAPAPVTDISDNDIDAVAAALSDDDNNNGAADGDSAGDKDKQSVVNPEDDKSKNPATTDDNKGKATAAKKRAKRDLSAENQDRASNSNAENQDPNKINPVAQTDGSTKIEINENNADTMPNAYAWGSSDNTYSVNGEKHTVTFHFAAPKDGSKITSIAIFPSKTNGFNNEKSEKGIDFYSGNPNKHQAYSGEYIFTANPDRSATLEMSTLFRNGNIGGAEKYTASRSIFLYVTKDGNDKETIAYKTNVFRAVTLVPPKTSSSVVLKYNQELTPEKVQAAITEAGNVETARSDKKSVNDQLSGAFTQNINVKSDDAYDKATFDAINKETSAKGATNKTYVVGAKTLNTYMVTDLGFKSEAIPLTVARYDTRIDKPIVDDVDINKLTDDQKADICKKLAQLNHVPQDKVTFNDKGEAVINFDGVDPNDAPKIPLRDLVLKKIEEKDITVPAADKATIVYNPLAYNNAEIARIKKAIYEANKDNPELGLSATDYENQISLEYLKGNLTATGDSNKGISNGQAENTITVKIKTDKAVAEFTSDVKAHKLTRLADIRKDYDVSWKQNKIDGRDSDEGLSWSEDKKTIIYRYDPTKAQEFDTNKILDLLKATPKDKNSGLRDLTGNEKLDHEGVDGKAKKSHVGYVIKNDQPTTELSLGNMSGAYWQYSQKVSNSGVNLGDTESIAGSYSWDEDAKPVFVAAKKDKVYKARLFVLPYGLTMYRNVYMENGNQPWNTPKAINVIFVPQTNHKKDDLSKSIGEHKTENVEGKDVPTQPAYYNASDKKKEAYDKALQTAKDLLATVKDKQEKDLTEQQKAQIDNATINLNKARAELDGPDTDKEKLKASIDENGKAAEGNNPATLTQATNQFKNVSDPDFKDANGNPDAKKNQAAKDAKAAYEKALEDANNVNSDANATQKAVDDAKAKLDAARAKLNEFSTNKDKLNAALAEHGHVYEYTNDTLNNLTVDQKLEKADPTYKNSTDSEREAYDNALEEAIRLSTDPNASQKDVNAAITALEAAKKALDAKATDKSKLITAEKQSFDNPDSDESKQSVFYKNALNKQTNGANEAEKQAAKNAIDNYNNALSKAREVLKNEKATQAQVDEAKQKLEEAENALHNNYKSDDNDLTKAIANNVSGYLMPAYFNAFDQANKDGENSQAAKDFKAYNDAYQKAKALSAKLKETEESKKPKQTEIDAAKTALEEARKVIDKYATDTSKISAALLNSLAIKNSPAYKNASAGAEGSDAKKAQEAYEKALQKLHDAFDNKLPKDKQGDTEIPESVIPDQNIDMTNKDALKKLQAHAKGQPLNRDVTKLLEDFNKAVADLNKFATKTDELLKSVNEDDATKQTPAYKNASVHQYLGDDGNADSAKNTAARKAANDYGEALNKAKELLKNPDATQNEVNEALKTLKEKRAALDAYNTDTTKLKDSVDKNGKDAEGANPAVEGTKDSDAYRNVSDPHFLTADGKPDDTRNNAAKQAKADYDKALTKAQDLLKKHDSADTPQDAKPTQKDINDALDALDKARKKLDDNYKTVTTDLEAEANKSTPEHAAVTENDFENTPEFKNADAKKKDGTDGNKVDNDDVKAYKDALAKARKLAQDNASQTLSDHPTQKQIDDALEALKQAKQAITDGYKTNVDKLKQAKEYAEDVFKKTPEYKNATDIKDDANNAKHEQAGKDLDGTDQNPGLSKLVEKIATKLQDTSKMTQTEVDALVKQLVTAQKKITENYKTNVDKIKNEVGDKDQDGKPVVPPFEASVAYKNALAKKDAESEDDAKKDTSATKKLEAYNEKLKAANELINKVKNPDPNAKPEDRPTQKQVDDALTDLQKAKKDIDDAFATNAKDLKTEAAKSTADGATTVGKDDFEATTEFKNADSKKTDDGKDNADVTAYKEALKKARTLLNKFDENGKPKSDAKDVPSQQEVDEALKNLKEIKDKITKNYVTSPHDLQQEVDKSKDGKDDTSTDVFENTPAFKNATAKGDDAAKQALDDYKDKLAEAKRLLGAFNRNDGTVKDPLPTGMTQAPTQKQLDDALKALQDAKKKLTDEYATNKSDLSTEAGKDSAFTKSPEYVNAQAKGDDASKQALDEYKKALDEANSVLGNENATQTEVDAALKKLEDAKKKLTDGYRTDSSKLKSEADADGDFTKSPEYLNAQSKGDDASKQDLEAYKKALEDANKVLGDANATQSQVDEALKKLQDAKKKLTDSHKTDKAALQTESDADGDFTKTPEYQNAVGSPEAEAYKKALDEANSVLKDPQATQAQVDAALKKLQDAKRVINDEYATQKQALKDEVAKSKDDSDSESDGQGSGDSKFEDSLAYKNAVGTPELDEYKRALEDARRVLEDPHATRSAVLAALTRLQEIKRIIIEKYSVDKSALRSAVDSDPLFRKSTAYIVAESRDLDSYKQAFEEAKRVLDAVNTSQAQIDEVLQRLEEAKRVIIDKFNSLGNGGSGTGFGTGIGYGHLGDQNPLIVQSVDKSGLQQIIDDALRVVSQHSEAYKRLAGSVEVKRYDDALANAQGVVADANASRDMVNTAGAELRDASGVLLRRIEMYEGKGNRGGKIANTGAGVSLFAWASAIFAGLGFAGVSRRRKHSDK